MSTRVITSVAVVGTLVLASCMQDSAKSPISPTGPSPVVSTTASCSFSTINNDARAYFSATNGPSKDQVFSLISAMQDAYKTGSTAELAAVAATGPGFQVLGRLGNAVGTSAVSGTAAQGNTFANDVLLCMAVTGYSYPTDFLAALGTNGLFGVRAGGLNTAVISRGDDVNGKPLFGAEPSGNQWHASAPYILFWGYPISTATFTSETSGGQAFQLNELPTLSFPYVIDTDATPDDTTAGPIKAGVCRMEEGARILHEHSNQDAILPNANEPNFCTNEPVPTTNVGFRGLMQRVGDWLAPQPLYAFAFGGGGSALVGDLSPLGPVTFTPVITFTVPPQNTTLSATPQFPLTVTVSAGTSNGTPFVGTVTLMVVGNNGSFNISGNVAQTNSNGVAVFPNLYIDKAGGYDLTAVTDIGASAPASFKIQGL